MLSNIIPDYNNRFELIYTQAQLMDQDFDFEDDYQKPKQSINNNKKKNYEDDFFDLDEPKENRRQNQAVFPAIRNSGNSKINQSSRNSKNINPFTENIKNRNNQEEYQFQEEVVNNPSHISDKKKQQSPYKPYQQEVKYEEEVQSVPIKKSTIKKQPSEKQEQENYGEEDFQEDNYGNDFEEEPQQTPKKAQAKSKTDANLKKAPYKLPPKIANNRQANSRQKPGTGAKSNTSRQKMNRSRSRQNSRDISSAHAANKYTSLVQKNFPQVSINNEQPDKIMKINDKMRLMIKKLNEQLNIIIDRNMLQLKKNNKNEKNVSLEDRCKVLQQEKKNNDQLIARLQYDLRKLEGKQQNLLGQQDELTKEQNVRDLKKKIKETEKQITQLKVDVNNQGKKLTKHQDDKKNSQNILNVKNNLLQCKRDEQKGTSTIQKLDQKFEELTNKMNQVENLFKQKVQEAHNKGLNLGVKKQLIKNYQEQKKKIENLRNHRSKIGNLLSTKADFIVHQNDQIKSSINNINNLIQTRENQIANSQKQSYRIIQKAKQNPKTNPTILLGLEEILKALESYESTQKLAMNDDDKKPEKNNKKNYESVNQQKTGPMRNLSRNKVVRKEEIQQPNQLKPTLIKKKKGEENRDGKQRVWRDQQQTKHNTIDQHVKKDNNQAAKADVLLFQQKQREQDKKKPFTLKKNRKNNEKADEPKQQIVQQKKKQQQKKPDDTPSMVAPKMMKFKRNKNNQDQDNTKSQAKLITEQKPKEEQSQIPSFAPKRFNLRNRSEKKQESYMPTTQVKNQNKISEQIPKNDYKSINRQQEYKPIKKQNTYQPPGLKLQLDEKKQEKKDETISSKPTFNLRLRDRKKNQQQSSYNPLEKSNQDKISAPQKQQKQETNDVPKFSIGKMRAARNRDSENITIPSEQKKQQPKEEVNNPYNPYANANNAPKRERQGKIKKPKLQTNLDKPKLNIYEQAQDLTGGLNQFVGNKKTVEQPFVINSNKQDDINAMLGIKKQKPMQGYEDLLGGNNNQHVGRRQRNKKEDFFGDMDI